MRFCRTGRKNAAPSFLADFAWFRRCTLPSSVVSHYRLLNPLGSGGMGVVYLAEDTTLGRLVTLKCLSPQIVHDPKRVDRFRNEARTASSLNHPNICTIYEVGEQDGELFIAMEYVEEIGR